MKMRTAKKTLLMMTFILLVCSIVSGQEIIGKNFYKSKYGEPAIDEHHAKVVELIIKERDSSLRYEMRMIKDNKILQVRCYKDSIPVGRWKSISGKEIDYDFGLKYKNTEYPDIIYFDYAAKSTRATIEGTFEPPLFLENDNNFQKFISMNLIYPEPAVEYGIQGKVFTQFIIDETGKLTEVSITKSANKLLDKEAARVIRQSPNWKPAMLNGKPVKVCITMKIGFVLQ